jgi:hypothetical protein
MKGENQVTMAIINRNKNQNQPASVNSYSKQVREKSHALIADILKEKLPLSNLAKNLDLEQDKDYRNLLIEYRSQYNEDLPDTEEVAHEIAYEYLLMVIKSLVGTLKEFACHEAEYMEGII